MNVQKCSNNLRYFYLITIFTIEQKSEWKCIFSQFKIGNIFGWICDFKRLIKLLIMYKLDRK